MAVSVPTAGLKALREGHLVHVLKQLILLGELIFEIMHLGCNLPILRFQPVHLHLRLHVLLVQILTRL